ncbi:hypothetical protein FLONG3_9737 [Fusarium longipes]|uniref:Uncharacterized protein n=1 Tax=Fusarium longipes TaxID=694270 RepID=A0A395RUT9_9HYPO|nr:hypothetical protein FLONG3_9737 [Fusarium longipes]
MEVRRYEGLEVYTDSASNAPEVYQQSSKDPMTNHIPVVGVKKGPFGLSIWTLCTLVVVITALITGAGVGGGLGAALTECKSSIVTASSQLPTSVSACPTPTSTDGKSKETTGSEFYKPKAPDQVANLTLPEACSENNGSGDYTTTNGYAFTYTYGWDYPGNDIAPIIAYTAFDCMHA